MAIITDEREDGTLRIALDCQSEKDGMTKQAPLNDVKIGTILERIRKGEQPPPAAHPSYYGDFSNAGDYQSIMERVAIAQQRFDALPAKVRDRFHEDPAELIEFANDPANLQEAIDLGLLERPQQPQTPPEAPPEAPPSE